MTIADNRCAYRLTGFVLTVFLFVALNSCSVYYGAPNTTNNSPYLPSSFEADSVWHISGGGGYYDGPIFNQNENNQAFSFHLYTTKSIENFTNSFGAFGLSGVYDVKNISQDSYNGKKKYGVLGVVYNCNYRLSLPNVDFNIIGLRAGASREFGEYASFKENATKLHLIDSLSAPKLLVSCFITSEICLKANRTKLGLNLAYGGSSDKLIPFLSEFQITGFLQYSRLSIWLQKAYSFADVNMNSFNSVSVGFTYDIGRISKKQN